MFKTKQDEDTFMGLFRVIYQEWGSENIVLLLPKSWREHVVHDRIPQIDKYFITDNSMTLCVVYESKMRFERRVELAA